MFELQIKKQTDREEWRIKHDIGDSFRDLETRDKLKEVIQYYIFFINL